MAFQNAAQRPSPHVSELHCPSYITQDEELAVRREGNCCNEAKLAFKMA